MKASECKCIECGQQAVAFWPVIDPESQAIRIAGSAWIKPKWK